ncbi:Kelch repeat-containing protein [Alteromonas sp. 009811495]|uniref:Kelch repeat-containing protein n=1 Tax=Alteromonas sp. 009811495 TaxID=3002962 RepID=UPI00237D8BE8|nr:kelch repeat-containing protein [Alteromonas sp. 009811495]WDT85415.1 galactose oxidase [Alteromonas sp. 009811495]
MQEKARNRSVQPGVLLTLITFMFTSQVALANTVDEVSGLKMWQDAPSLPYRVQEIYPTVFENHIVVAGGLSPDVDANKIGVSKRVIAFNIENSRWIEWHALPEPRHHPMLIVVSDRLFAFGGFVQGSNGMWHNSVDVLELIRKDDTKSNAGATWNKVAKLPGPLAETLSAVHNNKVHLVSGRAPSTASNNSQWNDQSDVNTHYVFDPQTLSFTQAPAIPTARNSACSVVVNNSLHTIGGRTVAGGNLNTHEVYSFTTQKWETRSPLPDAQGGLACASLNNRIYVFGGEYFNNGGGVYSTVWEYDIAQDKWQAISEMPNPRHGLGALTVDKRIYVIGGALQAGGNQTSALMTVFQPDTH